MKAIQNIDWSTVYFQMNQKGFATINDVLTQQECAELISNYNTPELYRSVISMERYRFGNGEYKYFNYPLPQLIQTLRKELYSALAPLANQWSGVLNLKVQYPNEHEQFIAECNTKNQTRPTPLILKYEAGGFNTLHQDLYGDIYFPFQVVFMLTQFGKEHEGGELVMVEQIPRAQSKAEVIRLNLGDAMIFTTNFRPVKGTKGYYRAKMKHGVSEVKSGMRFAMGVIFHDAA
jgi:hypothetical protein